MELNALLGQPVALPSLPRTVALLMNELARREPSSRRLNLLFGSDPVLAARLLELANAPAHQLTRQVAGISEALVLLGSAPLQTLVSSATLGTAATAQHLEQLLRLHPRLTFCFDGDRAGRRAAAHALEVALPQLRDGHQLLSCCAALYHLLVRSSISPERHQCVPPLVDGAVSSERRLLRLQRRADES